MYSCFTPGSTSIFFFPRSSTSSTYTNARDANHGTSASSSPASAKIRFPANVPRPAATGSYARTSACSDSGKYGAARGMPSLSARCSINARKYGQPQIGMPMRILGGSETNTHAFFFLQLSCLRAIAAKTCKNRTVCEPEPRCMPSEAEAREDPFADDTRIVREDVCWEEEGKVLHRTNYNQNNNSS